jgi:hypothetical protein
VAQLVMSPTSSHSPWPLYEPLAESLKEVRLIRTLKLYVISEKADSTCFPIPFRGLTVNLVSKPAIQVYVIQHSALVSVTNTLNKLLASTNALDFFQAVRFNTRFQKGLHPPNYLLFFYCTCILMRYHLLSRANELLAMSRPRLKSCCRAADRLKGCCRAADTHKSCCRAADTHKSCCRAGHRLKSYCRAADRLKGCCRAADTHKSYCRAGDRLESFCRAADSHKTLIAHMY